MKEGNDFSFSLKELCDDGSDPNVEFIAIKQVKSKKKGNELE